MVASSILACLPEAFTLAGLHGMFFCGELLGKAAVYRRLSMAGCSQIGPHGSVSTGRFAPNGIYGRVFTVRSRQELLHGTQTGCSPRDVLHGMLSTLGDPVSPSTRFVRHF